MRTIFLLVFGFPMLFSQETKTDPGWTIESCVNWGPEIERG